VRAAVTRQAGLIEVEEIDTPTAGPGQVLVQLVAAGVCHSDLTGLSGMIPIPTPLVLGHEGAGIVEAVGVGVDHVGPGDHVVLSITDGCGLCFQCQLGAYGVCEISSPRQLAGTLGDGTTALTKGDEIVHTYLFQSAFADYAVVSKQCAVKVRDDAPLDVASLLACGFSTGYGAVVRRARVQSGATVLVLGLGGVGLAAVMAARLAGAAVIIGADRSREACELGVELGVTHPIVVGPDTQLPTEVVSITGRGTDHAFDVVGTSDTIDAAYASIRSGGEVVAIGLNDFTAAATVPIFSLFSEKRLTGTTNGSIRPHVDIPLMLDHFMAGRLPVDRLITRRYKLDEIATALGDVGKRPGRGLIVF
jgi:Zn-dependent alcohol dehydrogenase